MARGLLVVASALAGACQLGPPAPPLTPEGSRVRVVVADEHGDEWLHDHCTYQGTIDPTSSTDARNRAAVGSSNVLAPVSPDMLPPDHPSREGLAAYDAPVLGTSKMFACDRLPEGI
jgi:hypothetical protein